ncbi:hypothetical protein Sjap_015298 [Stephania japonica]|uniref:Uncharacterized protein n=1 Tax=Stephania japonica TaxID=461633 RepID=A0AAP0NTV4_9MAGN
MGSSYETFETYWERTGTGKGNGKGKVRGGRGSRLEGERIVEKNMGDRRRRGDREEWGVGGWVGRRTIGIVSRI